MYSISGTYDRTSLKLYINGELVGTMAYTGAITSPEDSTKLAIGCNPKASACTGGYFNGNIYAVRVYTRALSADEVKQNYFVDSLYMERFNNINPVINLNGGSSNLGILKYQYKTSSSNTWNDYDPDNLPSINENDITTLSVRTLNINHTDSNTFDDILYFDKDIPIGSLDYSIDNLDNFVVDVDVEAIDALSGVKNYG